MGHGPEAAAPEAGAVALNLLSFLADFIEQHRGVRGGKMFGRPAAYAGRRMFACIIDDTLVVKLSPDAVRRELAHDGRQRPHATARPFVRRGRATRAWVQYTPRTASDWQRLASVLEIAAREAAQQLTRE